MVSNCRNIHGKTTITDLCLGFIEPTKGEIYLNSTKIKEYKINKYRNLFSVVFQDYHVFNESAEKNIKLNYEIDESILDDILAMLNLNSFYEECNLPDLRVNGNVSGGQRQKISVGRALLQRRPIVIFDEAMSNIDAASSEKLLKTLISKAELTLIAITHEYCWLHLFDQIIYLGDKEIKAIGTHKNLYQNNEDYFKFISDKNKEI